MSVVRVPAYVSGSSGGYVYLGETSNDIVETATALQLKDANQLLGKR